MFVVYLMCRVSVVLSRGNREKYGFSFFLQVKVESGFWTPAVWLFGSVLNKSVEGKGERHIVGVA